VHVHSGEEKFHRVLGEGDFLGISILDGSRCHSGVARCYGLSTVLLIPGPFLQARLNADPFAKALVGQLRGLIALLYDDLYDLKQKGAKKKIASVVTRLLKRPTAILDRRDGTFTIPFGLGALARLVGVGDATARTHCRALKIDCGDVGHNPGELRVSTASQKRIAAALDE
jgi:CRP-like cAMP-binding protein